MTENQRIWALSRKELVIAVRDLGYPEEFADLLASQLKSPRTMERMTAYLSRVRPKSMEMIIDEMLAISSDAENWRKKKEAQEAQAGYSAWLNSETRWRNMDEES